MQTEQKINRIYIFAKILLAAVAILIVAVAVAIGILTPKLDRLNQNAAELKNSIQSAESALQKLNSPEMQTTLNNLNNISSRINNLLD
jgi:predicted PurR-regulated permease PerM